VSDVHVVGIGNALVDVVTHADEAFIEKHGLARGAATMVDEARAESVYADLGPATESSGGSAANTIAGLASFGASAAYVGRVRDDQLGQVFAHDLHALGVRYEVSPATAGAGTGRCLVMVTPDAQRTMCTYLGASSELHPDDIDREAVTSAQVTYLEGYLWDQPDAKLAIRHAANLAREAGRLVAFTLSDPLCVERHRAEFRALVEHEIDVLFANEAEICSLYEVDDFDAALGYVYRHTEIAVLTRSAKGSIIVCGADKYVVDAVPIDELVDTTGAGDQYAAGFLYGLTHGHELPACGRLGALAAAEVIGHLGARPEVPLATVAAQALD
jgi:sugar/nucleoside kinase (ribokinase family)